MCVWQKPYTLTKNTMLAHAVDNIVNEIIKHNSKKIQYSYFNHTLCFRKFPLQFLIRISPLRGPKTFPIQKLSPSILVRVTQSIQNFSQTTFLIRRSWDRCWISLPSKLRVLLPFYIPWEAIHGHSFHKNHGKSILV